MEDVEMKKILALILVLVMSLSYTVLADDLLAEDVFEDEEVIYEENTEGEEVVEESTDSIAEDVADPESYEESTVDTNVNNYNSGTSEEKIKVYVNGRRILFDADPMIVNGRTMVPVRAIFEALGATVTWDNNTRTATGVLGDTTINITIDQAYLLKNGEQVSLDSPALLSSGRTYVPVRAIAESYNCNVDWINDTKTVTIISK